MCGASCSYVIQVHNSINAKVRNAITWALNAMSTSTVQASMHPSSHTTKPATSTIQALAFILMKASHSINLYGHLFSFILCRHLPETYLRKSNIFHIG